MTTVTPGAEPVAWMYQAHTPDGVKTVLTRLKSTHYNGYPVTDETPLYATPPDALQTVVEALREARATMEEIAETTDDSITSRTAYAALDKLCAALSLAGGDA